MTEQIYLKNPYLRQLQVRIIDKKYENNKYYITTDKTIFYPNLVDGQPQDKGCINDIEVIDTYLENSKIIHVLNENIHSEKAILTIDWDNRLDLMQQHSGQHLLSSVFYKLFSVETKEFYIGKNHVYIDVDLPSLSKEDIIKIEDFANKIIFSNFLIKTYLINNKNKDNDNNSIRIVEIDNIDFTPCRGTHVRSTGEIGLIKIINYKKYNNFLRVEFICGNRALKKFRDSIFLIDKISKYLSVDKDNLLEKIKDMIH